VDITIPLHSFYSPRIIIVLVALVAILTAAVVHLRRTLRVVQKDLALAREQFGKDPLTGLFNRLGLELHAEQMWKRYLRERRKVELAVVFIDMDRFKELNDTFGHAFGDEALRVLGRTLKSALRETDIACRYGGDEFVLLMSGASHDGVLLVLDRLRQRFERAVRLLCEEQHKKCPTGASFSYGVSFATAETTNVAQLLGKADEAMYKNKRTT